MKVPSAKIVAAGVMAVLTTACFATSPADDYNIAGCTHNLQCISLNKSNVQLCDGSGNPLGLVINNKTNSSCTGSELRFQGLESVLAGNGRTYYYCWGVGGSDGQSGHVWVADMTARPIIDSSDVGCSGGVCNGRSAPDILLADGVTKKSYYIVPTAIPSDMGYYGPSDGIWRSFSSYGEPADPYSTNHTTLVWSWVNKSGGGIVRSMMITNEVFYPSDVSTIDMTAYNSSGVATGTIKAMYGSFWNGAERIYGWTVHSHHYGGGYYPHIVCRTCDP